MTSIFSRQRRAQSVVIAAAVLVLIVGSFGGNVAAVLRTQPTQRQQVVIEGAVSAGQDFSRSFGPDLEFRLRATVGWTVGTYRKGRDTNLARMTVPWRGPNALSIMGWNFLPNANAPSVRRSFMFSPEVGETITWDMVDPPGDRFDAKRTDELLARIEAFGQGQMEILRYKLGQPPTDAGSDAKFDTPLDGFTFRVTLSWPTDYRPK